MNDLHGKVPVLQAVRAAYGFFLHHWRRALPAAAIAGLAGAVLAYPSTADAESMSGGAALLGLLAGVVGMIVYQAALYRMALRPEDAGSFGLSIGSDEGRLAGVSLSLAVFVILVTIVAMTPLMLVVMSVAASDVGVEAIQSASLADEANLMELLGPAAEAIYIIGVCLIVALVVWIGARLSLAAAATIAERRFILMASWGWTRGSALRIVAAIMLSLLPVAIPLTLIQIFAGAAMADAGTAAQLLFYFMVQFVSAATLGVIATGLYAYLYQGLRPPREPDIHELNPKRLLPRD